MYLAERLIDSNSENSGEKRSLAEKRNIKKVFSNKNSCAVEPVDQVADRSEKANKSFSKATESVERKTIERLL